MTRQRILVAASTAFVAANLLHTLDHLRQGTDRLTTEVFAGGAVLTGAALVTLSLSLRGDPPRGARPPPPSPPRCGAPPARRPRRPGWASGRRPGPPRATSLRTGAR